MIHIPRALPFFALALAAGMLTARTDEDLAPRLESLRVAEGLKAEQSLKLSRTHMDGQVPVHHLQQLHRGVKVWGGMTSVREEGGELKVAARKVFSEIHLDLEPTLCINEIRKFVDKELQHHRPGPSPSNAHQGRSPVQGFLDPQEFQTRHLADPKLELVIFPVEEQRVRPEAAHKFAEQLNAEDVTYVVTGYRLAYHVATDAEVKGRRELMNYLVDAHTGEIIRRWNHVLRGAAAGSASTKYSGTVTLFSNQNGSSFETKDPFYFNNYVTAKATSVMPFTDADNAWGNGGNWADNTTAAKQTGAAELLYGIQRACQMLKAVWGRNGSSGTGRTMKIVWGEDPAANTAIYVTEDYMTFGYEDALCYDMTKLDAVGHEYGHSFDYYTAGLCTNSIGETGGMGEAHADIMGLLTEVYGKYTPNDPSNPATTIPEAGKNDPKTWINAEDAVKSPVNGGKGLRFFIKPSWDTYEGTLDAWNPNMSAVEVHAASGPTARMFYYLTMGAPSSSSHDGYTSYLPGGSAGVGLHKAANIWVKSMLSGRMNSSSKHLDARNACITTAKAIYGAGSPEEQAVWNAYAGVNVGQAWSNVVETLPSISAQPAHVTVSTSAKATFTVSATGGKLQYQWYKNNAIIGGATAPSYTTPATLNSDNGAKFHVTVSNSKGSVTSNSAILTVTPVPGTEKIANGGFENGNTSWLSSSGVIGSFSQQPAYEGKKNAWLCGNGKTTNEYLYQNVSIPTTATKAMLSFYLHIDTAETTTASPNDKMYLYVRNTSGTQLKTLATYSNLHKNADYHQKSFDLTAFKGQTIQIYFNAREDSALQTSFVVDRVSLMVQ